MTYFVLAAAAASVEVSELVSELSELSLEVVAVVVVVVAVFLLFLKGLSDLKRKIRISNITKPTATFARSEVFTVGLFLFLEVFLTTFLFGVLSVAETFCLLWILSFLTGVITGLILVFLGE